MKSKTETRDPRKERLAKALRDNLKRRKAQARDRAGSPAPDEPGGVENARKGKS